MSVNLADITFPNFVTGIKDSNGEWFRGGYDYQSQKPSGGWTRKSIINQVKHINLSDYQWTVDGAGAVSEPIELFKYPNGYSIKAVFRWELETESLTRVYITINWYDLNNDPVGTIPNVYQGYATYSQGYARGWGILEDAIVDLFLITRYYYDVDPSEGSPNHGLEFRGVYGFPSEGYIPRVEGVDYNDATGLAGDFVIGSWGDLESFSTYLHSHGDPFDGDPFTDEPIQDDPAGSDDTSEPGGGGGNYDNTSDPIDFPALPQGGALESGSIIAHRVVKQTLEAIFSKLWTKSIFDLDAMWQKSIENPMDAIVSLHALPCSPQVVADPNNIYIGNLDMEVTSPKLTSQYIEVDCGTVTLKEFWGSALDYSPYTRIEIYLPFIGVQTLRTEDVMKTNVHVKYHVDALTGDCIAFIKCGMSVLYTFNGNCKMNIPLSARSTDFLQKVAAAAGLAIGAVGVSVGGGAALAGATKAAQIEAAQKTATAADIQSNSMAVSSAANIASTKINTSRSGDISGGLSLMASFVPYFIIHRPVQSLAKDFNKFKGYTSNITKRLGDLTGFTEVEHVNLQGIPNATAAEMAEIKTALRNGVIF